MGVIRTLNKSKYWFIKCFVTSCKLSVEIFKVVRHSSKNNDSHYVSKQYTAKTIFVDAFINCVNNHNPLACGLWLLCVLQYYIKYKTTILVICYSVLSEHSCWNRTTTNIGQIGKPVIGWPWTKSNTCQRVWHAIR